MSGLFGMMGNYESRCVDRYQDDDNGIAISTAVVTDSSKPYETAVAHPQYNDGKWIVVELYDTKKEAQTGHDKWTKIMTSSKLPTQISAAGDCIFAQLVKTIDGEQIYEIGSAK